MKFHYFVCLIFIVILLWFIGWASAVDYKITLFLDVLSMLVVIIFPFIMMIILYGWKNIRRAFSVLSNKKSNKNILINAETFFEKYNKTIFSIAFIAFIISLITMLFEHENVEALGTNIAISSLYLLYAGILNIVIIMPYRIIINRKLIEMEN